MGSGSVVRYKEWVEILQTVKGWYNSQGANKVAKCRWEQTGKVDLAA